MEEYETLKASLNEKFYSPVEKPVAIRMAYSLYFRMTTNCPEFWEGVELEATGAHFYGIPIIFDDWCNSPKVIGGAK